MNIKKFFSSIDVTRNCRKYNLSIWQCPEFLFLVMGAIIVITIIAAYFVGTHYIGDPLEVALVIIILVIILFVISFVITQSFEKLAEANRMKSEFISIVSHQLRSPLTNLRWVLDFLTSGDSQNDEKKKQEYYKILKENSSRMGELIDNLLIVSKMEDGKIPLKKEKVSLEDLVPKIVESFQPLAQASNIQINFEAQKNLPKAFADPFQMKLLLDNLIGNAIHYTLGRGKIEIIISADNKKFFFKVKDNGVGIPKEDKKYIFKKFFRASNVLKYQTQGSGLGLYIAKCVSDSFKGKIGFESEEGKGSTFYFTMPIK